MLSQRSNTVSFLPVVWIVVCQIQGKNVDLVWLHTWDEKAMYDGKTRDADSSTALAYPHQSLGTFTDIMK